MSRTTVRAAVADSLENAGLTDVVQVYRSKPQRIRGEAPRKGFARKARGAVVWIAIPHDDESRIAMGGPSSGKKQIDYDVELHVTYFSPANPNAGQTGQPLTGHIYDELDAVIDALHAAIRSDRTLAGRVFSSGEGPIATTTDYGEVHEIDGSLEINSTIAFRVVEIITA